MTTPASDFGLAAPFGWIGRKALGGVAYLGGLGLLATGAFRSWVRPSGPAPALRPAVMWQLLRCLAMGLPLVALVHVGLGSFLSMQSYFGGTFVDGAGAVVGVGLIRNLAPLMAGMTLSALLAGRMIPDLRARVQAAAESEGDATLDGNRLALPRLLAGTLAGPVLGLWGSLVGGLIGWAVGRSLLGVSSSSFWLMFRDMLWVRDVIGLLVKGMAFGFAGALFACFEGLRGPADDTDDLDAVSWAIFRAICFSTLVILFINSSWFIFVYHAGPAFGPTLLAPLNP